MESKGRRVARTAAPAVNPASAAPAQPRAPVSANKSAKPAAAPTSTRPPEPPPPAASERLVEPVAAQTRPAELPGSAPPASAPFASFPLAQPVLPPTLARATEAPVDSEKSPEAAAAISEVVVQRIAPAVSAVAPPPIAAPASIAGPGGDTYAMLTEFRRP